MEVGEMPRLLAFAAGEMRWVEQVWKRRHLPVGRQLGSHEFEEPVGQPSGDAQGVRF